MAHSTKAATSRKPQAVVSPTTKPLKPHPDYPLSPRADGRWAKKVKGKVFIFAGTADEALTTWIAEKDYILLHGRRPPAGSPEGFSVEDACDHFLTAKKPLVASGEITQWTYNDYFATCERIIAAFGKTMLVESLRPADFDKLRASIAKQWGVVRLGNEVQRVRSVFKYSFDAGHIDRPVRYGPTFKRPTRKALRIERAKKGPRMFEAAEIRALMKKASPQMKAMILLGINAGFGNADVGNLPLSAIDLNGGWLNFPRPKTGINRRCKLWKETMAALKAAIKDRPEPKDEAHQGLLFITKYGGSWFKESTDNPISKEFRKLLDELNLHRPGLGFYALRHGLETIGGEARDQVAVNAIMGHVDASMAGHYRERISDERLEAVVNHVHAWLFPPEQKRRSRKPLT